MKRFFAEAVFVLASSLISISALAQSYPPNQAPPIGPGPSTGPTNHSYRTFPELVLPPNPGKASSGNRPHIAREDRVLKKGLLAPSSDDRVALEAFLRTRDTGLIRLLPREVYDSPTYRKENRLNIRGGGAYYSFADLTHAYGYGSDIELYNNKLSVGFAGADFGMLTNIGDTPLEEITLDDKRLQQIAAYRPPGFEPEARAENRLINSRAGVMFDGFLYRKRLPVQENSTYLLRSVVYNTSDVLVAFRLVRKDTDGSVIIAWKRLKRYSAPRLEYNN